MVGQSSTLFIKPLIELIIQLQSEQPVSIVREWWAGYVHLIVVLYLHLVVREMAMLYDFVKLIVIEGHHVQLESRTNLGMRCSFFVGIGFKGELVLLGE